MHISTLESDERGKDDERRREDVTNSDTIDEDLLREPTAKDHSFSLDKGDGGVGAAEGETAGDEAEDKEVWEVGGTCDAEGDREWGGDTVEDDIERVADVLEDEKEASDNPIAPGKGHVD